MIFRVAVVLLGVFAAASARFEWAILMMESETAMLNCEDGFPEHELNSSLANTYVLSWKLPNGNMLSGNHNDAMFELKSGQNGIAGYVLEIKKFKYEYSGAYICMVEDTMYNQSMYILRGINMHDRKYASLAEKYEHNIIVAVVASVVFLVPFLGACLVYKYRWQSEEDKAARKAKKLGNKEAASYDNGVMKEFPPNSAAESVKASEGGGAYENPAVESHSTQL